MTTIIPTGTKICPCCHIEREKQNFRVQRRTLKDGSKKYKSYCRLCENAKVRKHSAIVRKRNRKWLNWHKRNHPCLICGEGEPICLDFHHIKPKPGRTSKASFWVHKTYSIETLKKKIEECALICSNCHRKVHVAVELVCELAGVIHKGTAYKQIGSQISL